MAGHVQYLSVQRAASLLGVAPHTVRRWTASGFLPCTRTPGGHRRIKLDDVSELVQQIGGSSHLAARQARERELETLLETSIALVSQLELPDLLKEIAGRLTRLMECHFCAISTCDEHFEAVTVLAEHDQSGRRVLVGGVHPLARYPLSRRVLEDQITAVVNVHDPRADPAERSDLLRDGDKSVLLVPLVYSGRSIGLLELTDHVRERRYSRQDLRICTAIAGQAAVALHNAAAFSNSRRATQEITALCTSVRELGGSFRRLHEAEDVHGILLAAAEMACEICGGVSSVAECRTEGACYAIQEEATDDAKGERAAPERTPAADVVTAGDPSFLSSVRVTIALANPRTRGTEELLGLVAAMAGSRLREIGAGTRPSTDPLPETTTP